MVNIDVSKCWLLVIQGPGPGPGPCHWQWSGTALPLPTPGQAMIMMAMAHAMFMNHVDAWIIWMGQAWPWHYY